MSTSRSRRPVIVAYLLASLALLGGYRPGAAQQSGSAMTVQLARDGATVYSVVVAHDASATESYAASELAAYLERMSGASFPAAARAGKEAIVLRTAQSEDGLGEEDYSITVRGDSLVLTGGSGRAVLYAAYDLLERLGCRWLAPKFDFYEGAAEFVPRKSTLVYEFAGDVVESPVFAIRKLDLAGARSHTVENVRKMIEWMPKLRYNTLMASMSSGLAERPVRWDDLRGELIPELEKRGMLLQVGGHGYDNFLNPEMEGGTLFKRHPEWFGKDEQCRPSRAQTLIFNTGNAEAVAYLIDSVIRYVTEHPEIDIFGFWPPDMARWGACGEMKALGTVADRHARLVNQLHAELKKVRPDLRLEIIAFQQARMPPENVALHPDILVEFCPISQSFDAPIYDPSVPYNPLYAEAIRAWRREFPGDIGLYSYYRKYAWRSLPNVIPHYIQQDLKWYASVPLQGIHSYAEPGDWYTYELNHYVLGHLAWDPDAHLDGLIDQYALARYGGARGAAKAALASLENTFRLRGSIPFSAVDAAPQVTEARAELEARAEAVRVARAAAGEGSAATNLERLSLMLGFAVRDLRIQEAKALDAPPEALGELVKELVAFLTANQDRGVFVVYGGDDFTRMMKHYARDWHDVDPELL